jgi:hypothetical protein
VATYARLSAAERTARGALRETTVWNGAFALPAAPTDQGDGDDGGTGEVSACVDGDGGARVARWETRTLAMQMTESGGSADSDGGDCGDSAGSVAATASGPPHLEWIPAAADGVTLDPRRRATMRSRRWWRPDP